MVAVAAARPQPLPPNLPSHRDPYYAGQWQKPKSPRYVETISPGTGEPLGKVIDGSAADAEAAIAAARTAFREWRHVPPLERAKMLRPLAAGNTVVVKPPEQAPLSSLRLAELIDGILPPGVWNLVPGGREVGQALASHPDVAKVALIGSVPTGRAVMKAAADTLKPVTLELGGKNALIAFPDADLDAASAAVVDGMNFTWCGQSCGSTSRAFVHERIYDAVLERVKHSVKRYKPGIPTDPATTMGSIVSKAQYDRVLRYIEAGKQDGARLIAGGKSPSDPNLAKGFYVEPTVFADVTMDMRIGKEEIFGPVLSIFKWRAEDELLAQVNQVEYGLTCSIWTTALATAHRVAAAVEAGYVWINEVSKHFLGAPFGGYKQSGVGREEGIEELLSFTREKNIHINLKRRVGAH